MSSSVPNRSTPEIVHTIESLIDGARECRAAVERGDLDALGTCLSNYWQYKKTMVRGPPTTESGSESSTEGPDVEPPAVRFAIDVLQRNGLLRSASLCGAGGGGFLVLLTSDLVSSPSDLHKALQEACAADISDNRIEMVHAFSWHDCQLSNEGLLVRQLDASVMDDAVFDISWLLVERLS